MMRARKEKLESIYEIAVLIGDWMCSLERPIFMLISPIEKIRELSKPVDCFGVEDCNVAEYIECMRADACSKRARENQSLEEKVNK